MGGEGGFEINISKVNVGVEGFNVGGEGKFKNIIVTHHGRGTKTRDEEVYMGERRDKSNKESNDVSAKGGGE